VAVVEAEAMTTEMKFTCKTCGEPVTILHNTTDPYRLPMMVALFPHACDRPTIEVVTHNPNRLGVVHCVS
jgi:hypothetical protein